MYVCYDCGNEAPPDTWMQWGCHGHCVQRDFPNYDRLSPDQSGNLWSMKCINCTFLTTQRQIRALHALKVETLDTIRRIQFQIGTLIEELEE